MFKFAESRPDPLSPVEALLQIASFDRTTAKVIVISNTAIALSLTAWFFLIPVCLLVRDVCDDALTDMGIPHFALRLHRTLTPAYERWARDRVDRQQAVSETENISGTEWPLFGTAFYLWATEAIQEAYEKDPSILPVPPRQYAKNALEACACLLSDPNHARWVRAHWGADYLHNQNVFYRMLLIGGLSVHHKLTASEQYLPLLRDQVETLSRALDESPWGLLDDYPGECYPGDVLAAWACIKRADTELGTDHSAMIERAVRAFEGCRLDVATGLPPYAAFSRTGEAFGPARGCSNAYILTFAPELWPEKARAWYGSAEKHFWQHRWTADGFREFPRGLKGGEWYFDVDSGPVVAGHGIAATAFGVAAARANGRPDHAYPLGAEMIAASMPLPDGSLFLPRFLSNATDAPYLGEASVLFCLTRPALAPVTRTARPLPFFVCAVIGLYMCVGLLVVLSQALRLANLNRLVVAKRPCLPRVSLATWVALLAGAVALLALRAALWALVPLLLAQLVPRWKRRPEGDGQPAGTAPQPPK
ncbi:MAG: hypothetical protein V2A58_17395 [Planctomycetota bacterium]